jgi:very-short-patch-repair endonuclease
MASERLPDSLGTEFSVAQARDQGVAKGRLRGSDLEAPFHGARQVAMSDSSDELDAQQRVVRLCRSYFTVAPAHTTISHGTAAVIYGMPVPRWLRDRAEIDVTVPRLADQPRGKNVIGHRIDLPATRTFAGLPLMTPEETWVRLASALGLDDLIIAGDFLVRRKHPLSSLERIVYELGRLQRIRGSRLARCAAEEIRAGTDSPPETKLRVVIVRAGLPEPVIGFRVHDDGYFVGTPDLAYPEYRIALEYEGDGHRTSANVFRDDIARRELFEDAGWRVIRVTAADLHDPRQLISRIRRALAARS